MLGLGGGDGRAWTSVRVVDGVLWVLNIAGAITMVIGLVDLPESGRKWLRWLSSPRFRGESGRWIAVLVGLGLTSFAAFLGMSPRLTFWTLVAGVGVAGSVRLYQAAQGLPNWRACHEWPDPIQGEDRVALAVCSIDGDERRIALCRVRGPHGHSELDHAANVFGNKPQPTDEDEAPFPDPRFSSAPTRLSDGRYRVEWWADQGVGRILVRKDRFRVKKGAVTRPTRCMYD